MPLNPNRVRIKQFYFLNPGAGLTPAQITSKEYGWIKLTNKPFIRLHRIRVEPGIVWAHASSGVNWVNFNFSLNFYLADHETVFHWCRYHQTQGASAKTVLTPSDDSQAVIPGDHQYEHWRQIDREDSPFDGAILPSQFRVYSSDLAEDNVDYLTKDMEWYTTFIFEEVHEKIHPIAALKQRRRFNI